jgi:hypothetical protein
MDSPKKKESQFSLPHCSVSGWWTKKLTSPQERENQILTKPRFLGLFIYYTKSIQGYWPASCKNPYIDLDGLRDN